MRSRSKRIDEGEKMTKYFCNLVKQHNASKSIKCLEKHNGETTCNQDEILLEAKCYYKKLYNSQNNLTNFNLNNFFD